MPPPSSTAEFRTRGVRLFKENYAEYASDNAAYGARKIWYALRREGRDIARCTVERLMKILLMKILLMKVLEIQGVVRGKKVITTNPDVSQPCPDDKVNREFIANMPNQLWVSDFTYVSSWQGMVYVAFVIDVFARKITSWRVPADSAPT